MTAPSDFVRRFRDLFDAVSELSLVENEDAVLDVATRRARQLVGTDLAYVMLLDHERGDTYMRATEGTVSALFDSARLSVGQGLGGRVAQAMAPQWTRNYLSDEQYTHVIDPIVFDEGIVAMLGVPVQKYGQLIGILFVSDREERDFSQDDITLLALLADHVSVTLISAERQSQTQADLLSTRAALTAERSARALETAAADFHESVTRLVAAGAPLSEILGLLVGHEGGAALVVDPALREIGFARASDGAPVEPLRSAVKAASTAPDETNVPMAGSNNSVVVRLATGSDHVGYLAYAPVDGVDPSDPLPRPAPAIAHVSAVIALILLGYRAKDEADNRVRGELLAELLAPGAHDLVAVGRRAALLGVEVGSEMIAAVVTPPGGRVSRLLQEECSALARNERGLITAYGDRVALLLPGSDASTLASKLATRLASHTATVGASGPTTALAEVADHLKSAERAAQLLRALGREGDGAAIGELGAYGLLFSEVDGGDIERFIDQILGPVHKHDQARGTKLLETLHAWFVSEGSVSGAAERLFVHVNTVYQRLDRLDSILGAEWRTGDRSLEVRLALRLWELMAG